MPVKEGKKKGYRAILVQIIDPIFEFPISICCSAGVSYVELSSHSYINKIQQDATVYRYSLTAKSLYMFRVSIVPIIRST